ncbi:multidrug efflux system [uncultured Pleomorphomonas sp.]|uniref:Multidrug efflux system n=1 Tax=uncultured Pleomorphomonas sp. TaxID=442121 RepID=A0A212LKE4_9HYPH|nr:efflux RND transporter periplasmic adaptor subunit [uncultured Pleomorphomonas sp.]SCM77994.1 multidrug efflux system [uncultured Pleomorphomonas sp.]
MTNLKKLAGGVLLLAVALPLVSGCEQVGAVLHKAGDMLGAKSDGASAGAAGGGTPAGMQMPAPEVGFIVVHPTSAPIVEEVAGRTAASAVAEIRPQVGGIIEKRVFEEGSRVNAGDVLYRIDARSYQATLDAAKADLERYEASVPSAQAKFDRYQELANVNGVSKQDIDEARSALLQAKAAVASAASAVRTAEINLGYTEVKAPISGLIGRSSVTEGALVTAGQATALATIRQIDPIYVDLSASSTSMSRMRQTIERDGVTAGKEGPRVTLKLDDNTVYEEVGHIISTEANVDETTDTVTLRSSFANSKMLLLPGMYMRAAVEIGTEDDVFLLPQRAVTRTVTGQATAYFLTPDNKVEARVLNADRAYGFDWVVEKDVADGDRLIVEGVQKIRPGMEVKSSEVELGANGLVKPKAAAAAPANTTP